MQMPSVQIILCTRSAVVMLNIVLFVSNTVLWWFCLHFRPHVRWGTQEMLWPIKDSSLQKQPSERIIALSAPKPNFLKGDKITRYIITSWSCGNKSNNKSFDTTDLYELCYWPLFSRKLNTKLPFYYLYRHILNCFQYTENFENTSRPISSQSPNSDLSSVHHGWHYKSFPCFPLHSGISEPHSCPFFDVVLSFHLFFCLSLLFFLSLYWDKPRHEKTCLRGLRPGKTQTGLLSYKS